MDIQVNIDTLQVRIILELFGKLHMPSETNWQAFIFDKI